MEAQVFRLETEWFVSMMIAGILVDQAGPFDDETDAEDAMERCLTIAGTR